MTQAGIATITGKLFVRDAAGSLLQLIDKNDYGGLQYVYDSNGYINTKLGVESGTASNVAGTFLIFNDLPSYLIDESPANYLLKYQRVTAGIIKSSSDSKYSYGGIQVKSGYRHDTDSTQSTGVCTVYLQGGEYSLPRGQINLYEGPGYSGNYGYTSAILGAGHPDSSTEAYRYGAFLKLNAVNGSNERVFVGINSSGSGYCLFKKSDNTDSIKIQDDVTYFKNANVGIGTTAPTSGYKLDVNGNIKASGYASGINVGVSGTFTSADGKTIIVSGGIITGIT